MKKKTRNRQGKIFLIAIMTVHNLMSGAMSVIASSDADISIEESIIEDAQVLESEELTVEKEKVVGSLEETEEVVEESISSPDSEGMEEDIEEDIEEDEEKESDDGLKMEEEIQEPIELQEKTKVTDSETRQTIYEEDGVTYVSSYDELLSAITGATAGIEKVIAITNDISYSAVITVNGGRKITLVSDSDEVRNLKMTGTARHFSIAGLESGLIISENIVLDGGSNASTGGGVGVTTNGSFILDGGKIINCRIANGGGISVSSGTFKMIDGEVNNNAGTSYGGGVYLISSTFTMEGGKISNNTGGTYGGGGIYASSSLVEIKDGEIHDNKSNATNTSYGGGGVSITSSSSTDKGLVISGGKIYNNVSNTNGGGVFSSSSAVSVLDGNLNNNSGSRGGGIYTDSLSTLKTSNNVKFNSNSASSSFEILGLDLVENIGFASTSVLDHPINGYDIDSTHVRIFNINFIALHSGKPISDSITLGTVIGAEVDLYQIVLDSGNLDEPVSFFRNGTSATRHNIEALSDIIVNGDINIYFDYDISEFWVGTYEELVEVINVANIVGSTITIYLTDNIEYTSGITISGGANISLKSDSSEERTLLMSSSTKHFIVEGDRTIFTVNDGVILEGLGQRYVNNGGVYINKGATFNLTGGGVKNCSSLISGGAVTNYGTFNMSGGYVKDSVVSGAGQAAAEVSGVGNSGIFNMTGGEISGSSGAVAVKSYREATFNFIDGKISNNQSGAVSTIGVMTMYGGEINGNSGGVSVGAYGYNNSNAKFVMNGGEISGNRGTGVYMYDSVCTFIVDGGDISNNFRGIYAYGTVTIEEGKITNNTGTDNGAGIYVAGGTVTMNGGEISNNSMTSTSTTSSYGGGGVYVSSGNVDMFGGKITNNAAVYYGGGIFVNGGEFNMHDGEISGNSVTTTSTTATYGGGGVRVNGGKFNAIDGKITGNSAPNGGGIYTAAYSYITTSDAIEFSDNKAATSRYIALNNSAYPNIGFASTSIWSHPINNFDINIVGLTTTNFNVNFRNTQGETIASTISLGRVDTDPKNILSMVSSLDVFDSYEPVYFTMGSDTTQRSVSELKSITVTSALTIYFDKVTKFNVNFYDISGESIYDTEVLRMLEGSTLNVQNYLPEIEHHEFSHFAIGNDETKYEDLTLLNDFDGSSDIDIFYVSTMIILEVPTSMEFTVTEITEGKVVSPMYEIINYSQVSIDVNLKKLEMVDMDGVVLVSDAKNASELHLDIVSTNSGQGTSNIEPNTELSNYLDTLGRSEKYQFEFGGQFVGSLDRGGRTPKVNFSFSFTRAS